MGAAGISRQSGGEWEFCFRAADGSVWLFLCHRFGQDCRTDWQFIKPDFWNDHRHADGNLLDLSSGRMDRRCVLRHCSEHWGCSRYRRSERRRNDTGPENGVPGRWNTLQAGTRLRDWRDDFRVCCGADNATAEPQRDEDQARTFFRRHHYIVDEAAGQDCLRRA